MSASQAHVILSRAEIKPHRTEYWMMTDYSRPEFEERLSEICGLYVDPPAERAGRLDRREDRDPGQGADQARPTAPAGQARAARARVHQGTGTQCLFACLNVHEGDVLAMPSKTRNRWDLIRFLDLLDDEFPVVEGREIVAITDNLSTRGTEESRAVADRPSALDLSVHPQARLLAQPDRDLLLDPLAPAAQARHLHQRDRPRLPDARIRRDLQPDRQAVQVDLHRQGPRSVEK